MFIELNTNELVEYSGGNEVVDFISNLSLNIYKILKKL